MENNQESSLEKKLKKFGSKLWSIVAGPDLDEELQRHGSNPNQEMAEVNLGFKPFTGNIMAGHKSRSLGSPKKTFKKPPKIECT